MPDNSYPEILKGVLRRHPGEMLIVKDGSAALLLAGPELDDVIIIKAPVEENFNNMTDRKIQHLIETALKK